MYQLAENRYLELLLVCCCCFRFFLTLYTCGGVGGWAGWAHLSRKGKSLYLSLSLFVILKHGKNLISPLKKNREIPVLVYPIQEQVNLN